MKLPNKKYSGDKSKKFWKAVNSITDEKKHQKVYGLAVKLQAQEDKVFTELEAALAKPDKPEKPKKAKKK